MRTKIQSNITRLTLLPLLPAALALTVASNAHAAFSPIALNPASFNHDPVVEASAPISLNDAVNATMDGGTNKNGNTWFEQGYYPGKTNGLPPAGSVFSQQLGTNPPAGNHTYRMPPDYHVNNVIMVGHNNGGRRPLIATGSSATSPATLTFTTPAAFTGLSFLNSSGNGPVLVGYTIHYADATTEAGVPFTSINWFDPPARVWNAAGRVSLGGALQNIDAAPAAALYATDVSVGSPAVNIASIDFYYVGSAANGNTNNNGRACIFAVSGAKDGSTDYTNTIAVTGFNYDAVVEADGPQTANPANSTAAAASVLTNNVTTSMDGGLSKLNSVWYEKGYYRAFPNTGIPAAGSTIASATLPASYTMASSYAGNCAFVLATNVTSANIAFSSPAAYRALSFLCAAANGDSTNVYVINFADGSSETGFIFIPDWFNRVIPPAYLTFGRVTPYGTATTQFGNRTVNNTPDQFLDRFVPIPPVDHDDDFRPNPQGGPVSLPVAYLFDAVINVTNTTSAITNVSLSFTNAVGSTRVTAIFAVSGAAVGSVPPQFGFHNSFGGVTASGQPGGKVLARPEGKAFAVRNDRALIKAYEGTNVIVLSVTNILAGAEPVTYQWKKAPRGQGFHDIHYTIDYNLFANVANGGRVAGATSSALVISNALTADSADYLVVASNGSGSVTSLFATVMILSTNVSVLVGQPAGDAIATIDASATPVAESLEHVIDQVQQKWLSDGLQSATCCPGPLPFVGPVGYTVTPVSGTSVVTALRFYVANDGQGRDPYDYFLEGSNDGSTWTPITGGAFKGSLFLPFNPRNGTGAAVLDPFSNSVVEVNFANASAYKSYRVSITNSYDNFGQGLMQIGEIQLLGTFLPAPPLWVRQPDPAVTVYAGGSPVFGVQATGLGSLTPQYQWYKNLTTAIPNATSKTYTFPNAQLADSGTTFRCVAFNNFGSITSSIATLTVIAAPAQSYPSAVAADNASGYWRLNEADNAAGNNGALAHDYRGGHNGYYSNAVLQIPGYNPASDPDKAADFGNFATIDSYVAEIKDVDFARPAPSTAAFSVEAWVYGGNQTVNAAIVTKGYNGILAAGTGTGTEQFALDVAGADPRKFRFLVRDAAGNGYVALSSVVPYDPLALVNTWRHLVGVCDQPNGKVYLYVDGLLAASGSIGTNVGVLAQPLAMTIGSRKSGGASEYDNQWVGRIDDVAIYNSALSANQALSHFYAAQRPPIITLQPTNTTSPDNVSVTFYSAAYGAGTVGYQWYLSDGTVPTSALAGKNSANLTFTTTPAQNNNFYQLVATNQFGATTSLVAQLTVVSGPPSFLVDLPPFDTFFKGHIIQLRVVAGGTAPFTYQWVKNAVNLSDNYRISGSQTAVLTIGCADPAIDSGQYFVQVGNAQGITPSGVDVVVVTNATPFTPFNASGTGWTRQGSTTPIMGNNRLELTSGLGNTARSAFLTDQQSIASFNASFVYQVTSGAGGADGVTFCIQNGALGAAALGGGGGALGYSGITPSVALAMNIYDPNTRGIQLLQNGTLPAAGAGAYAPITPVLVGGNANPIQVNVSYSGGVMTATFRDTVTAATFTTNRTVDIPGIVGSSVAYVGFTGADGGVASTQVISNFTMLPAPVTLKFQKSGDSLVLSWPASAAACLQSSPTLTSPVWTDDVTDPFRVVGSDAQVTVTPLIGTKYYRLQVYP